MLNYCSKIICRLITTIFAKLVFWWLWFPLFFSLVFFLILFLARNDWCTCSFMEAILRGFTLSLIPKTIITFSSSLIQFAIKIAAVSWMSFTRDETLKGPTARPDQIPAEWGNSRDRDRFRVNFKRLMSGPGFHAGRAMLYVSPFARCSLKHRMENGTSGSSYELIRARATRHASNRIKCEIDLNPSRDPSARIRYLHISLSFIVGYAHGQDKHRLITKCVSIEPLCIFSLLRLCAPD